MWEGLEKEKAISKAKEESDKKRVKRVDLAERSGATITKKTTDSVVGEDPSSSSY